MNYYKAISSFYKARVIEPTNIKNLLALGSCYSLSGRDFEAKSTFNEILEIDSLNKNAMINLSASLMALEEYKKASELFNKLISTDSMNSYFYYQMGICKLRTGEKKEAIENFNKSIQLHNSNAKVYLLLAKLYSDDEKYEEAIIKLQLGLTQNSSHKTLNKMLADIYYKSKSYNDAIIKYLYTITIGDSSSNVYQKLGMSYYYVAFSYAYRDSVVRELKLNEAILALKKAITKDGKEPVSFLYLGLCYKELGKHEEAIKYLEKALNRSFPEFLDEIYANLGSSYRNNKKYVESIKAYKESLHYNPAKKTNYFYLANVYDNYYEDKSVAVLYYKKFISESTDADENLIGYSLNRIGTLTKESNFWQNGKTGK